MRNIVSKHIVLPNESEYMIKYSIDGTQLQSCTQLKQLGK